MKKIVSFLIAVAILMSMIPVTAIAFGIGLDSIKAIEYRPYSPRVLYEETGGNWSYEENGIEQYYQYNVVSYSTGDVLSIIYNDDTRVDYTCEFDDETHEFIYRSNGGDTIDRFEVDMYDEQWQHHFYIETENFYYVRYQGKTASIPVTIIKNPVSSIAFVPSNPIVIYEHSNGEWDHDDSGDYYRYYGYSFVQGDKLFVTYTESGEEVEYTYLDYYNSNEMSYYQGFYDSSMQKLDSENLYTTYSDRWEKDADNVFYVEYKGRRSEAIHVQIIENPVSAIRYEKIKDVTYVEGDTYYDQWDDRNYYSRPNFENGDRLIVIDSHGGETVYTFNSMFWAFVCDGHENIQTKDVRMYDNQRENEWVQGDDNEYYVEYLGSSYTLYVSIVTNPVKSIEYIPAKNVELIEGANCRQDEYNGEQYTRYDYRSSQISDILRITDNDDVVTSYTLTTDDSYNWCFISDSGDTIDYWDVRFGDEQYLNNWHIGSDNEYFVEYSGRRFYLYATMSENIVKGIEYKPKETLVLIEGYNTYTSYYNGMPFTMYNYDRYRLGDILTVIDKEDKKTDYTLVENEETYEWYFQSADGDIIDTNDIIVNDEQYFNNWHIGDDNEYFVEYSGKRCYLYATINENPVLEIEFIPKNAPYVVEGADCEYDPYDDFIRYYEPPFEIGDKLIVTYKGDAQKTFVAHINEFGDMEFASQSDDEVISEWDIERNSDQWENHWSNEGPNEYYIRYMGREFSLSCDMIANPVVSIEFVPKSPFSYIEGTHMYFDEWAGHSFYEIPRIENGDTLTVTYADGSIGAVTYTAKYDFETYSIIFESESGGKIAVDNNRWLRINNNQYEEEWVADGDNNYTFEYYGKTYDVPVTIKKNTISEISIVSVKTPVIYANYYHTETNESGVEYKEYAIPDFQDGDILTITDAEGETQYVLEFCEEDGERYFTHGDEKIHPYEFMVYSNQDEKEWAVGNDNYYTVELYGFTAQVQVELKESDVLAIDFQKKNPIVIDERTGGEEIRDDFGELFYRYNVPLAEVGDKLIVTYDDNSVVEYTIGFDEVNGVGYAVSEDGEMLDESDAQIFDRQYEEHWKAGTNYFYVVYRGVEIAVPVTVNSQYKAGDINGDKVVDNRDLTRLFQYLSDWDVEVNELALDVNGDGSVDNRDLIRLFQYLSDWDVEIF